MSITLKTVNEHEILINSYLLKRNKSHSWQKKWFVLRRNQLSYYKDSKEYKASKVIGIEDMLSFTEIPDNYKNHFIIVTSARVYHLRALNDEDYKQWVAQLKALITDEDDDTRKKDDNEPFQWVKPKIIDDNTDCITSDLQNLQFSGTDDNFTSGNISDGLESRNQSSTSLNELQVPEPILEEEPQYFNSLESTTPDHIIAKGHLYRLKKRYNQWKKLYIILTNHSLFFFKNRQDFETNGKFYKKIDVDDILDCVEVDPLGKNKVYCMLIITALKRIRFCAENEDELIKWVVLLRTIVKTRKREREKKTVL